MKTERVALSARLSTLNHSQGPDVQLGEPPVQFASAKSVAEGIPLRLKRGLAEKLFAIPRFQNVSTEDLIHAARQKFAGRKPRKGIAISDRATAIAFLMGTAGCEEGRR
jgi:hypothetical protein